MSSLWNWRRSSSQASPPDVSSPSAPSPGVSPHSPNELDDDGDDDDDMASRTNAPDTPERHPRSPQVIDMAYVDRGSLPVPVSTPKPKQSTLRGIRKKARIESPVGTAPPKEKLRVHWSRFVRRMGTGTAPSSSSALGADESDIDGSFYYGRGRRSASGGAPRDDDEKGEVDEVVVDREWSHEVKTSVIEASEQPGDQTSHHPGTVGDHESMQVDSAFWGFCTPLIILRYRMWPATISFFRTEFHDLTSESHYKRENWFLRKSLAMWSATFFILVWAFSTAFVAKPWELPDKIFYGGIAPVLTFPIFFAVIYDWPRDHDFLYQIYISVAVWGWSLYQLFFMFLCGFYGPAHANLSCGTKDFIGIFYYAIGLPTIALFGLGLKRFPAAIGMLVFFIIAAVFVLPYKHTWVRNLLNYLLFSGFILYIHWAREQAERRLYILRDQLKVQFRATQKAQVNERKAADSKRRLTSYVFHEVRVPLNTALLAVQNMAATGTFSNAPDVEFSALEGSLSMMSKVLNDVLDFNRMDSGRFESVSKPFAFHQVMRSMFVPLRLATNARKLTFVTRLDERIDTVSRRASLQALGDSPASIAAALASTPDEPGMVVGDEMRLRQIITNLASNACKFTPAGGELKITTELLWPRASGTAETGDISRTGSGATVVNEAGEGGRRSDDSNEKGRDGLSAKTLAAHDAAYEKLPERIIVRIEIADTGCGIKNAEMVHNKLFSAFNQTEMGRQQGGKGTGLGLALVRQIVKRTGGRLGVKSKVGEGSTFWCELPFGIGASALDAPGASKALPQGPDELAILAGNPIETGGSVQAVTIMTSVQPSHPNDGPLDSNVALDTIMDQGGLVHFVDPKMGSTTSIPTRSIGDTSTGTAVLPASPSETSRLSHEIGGPLQEDGHPGQPTLHTQSPLQTVVRQAQKPGNIQLPPGPFARSSSPPQILPVPVPERRTSGGGQSTTSLARMPVLVVDDDHLTRMLMKRMLTRIGCDVTTAENGALGLAALGADGTQTPASEPGHASTLSATKSEQSRADWWTDECKFAVVFLDNQMPVLSGLQAVARLRTIGRRDLVVGVTGNALLSDQEEYIEAGVDHVLTKPVLERSLRSMLDAANVRRAKYLAARAGPLATPSPNSMTPPTPPTAT